MTANAIYFISRFPEFNPVSGGWYSVDRGVDPKLAPCTGKAVEDYID